eukprot:Pgem_evm1s17770
MFDPSQQEKGSLFREIHVLVLQTVLDLSKKVVREVVEIMKVTHDSEVKLNMKNTLSQLLVGPVPQEQQKMIISNAVQFASRDNLDYAISLIEGAAGEKAVAQIDEHLSSAYMQRRSHREHMP